MIKVIPADRLTGKNGQKNHSFIFKEKFQDNDVEVDRKRTVTFRPVVRYARKQT